MAWGCGCVDNGKALCDNCGTELPKNVCSVSCPKCGHKRDCTDS
jgi:hypothetical protein